MKDVPDDEVDKITHLNTMREFKFDPLRIRPQAKCTVGALDADRADVSMPRLGRTKMTARAAREFPSTTAGMAKRSD